MPVFDVGQVDNLRAEWQSALPRRLLSRTKADCQSAAGCQPAPQNVRFQPSNPFTPLSMTSSRICRSLSIGFTGVVGFAVWTFLAAACYGDSVSLTGSLDPNNPNDVVLYAFSLSATSTLTIQSYGYGGTSEAPGGANAAGAVIPAGGFDSYLSLFLGTGPNATFLASNDDGFCPPGHASPGCHDSTLLMPSLGAGTYTMALTVFDNFSFAENFGSGTLGDGFIGLGDYFDGSSGTFRTASYAVDISASSLTVAP